MTQLTLAFDVYGTLIDTHGVITALEKLIGDQAPAFSQTWRDKQLEYSFRRGLMQKYENFAVCTRHALDYTCQFYGVDLDETQKHELMAVYRVLPAFPDVRQGLQQLKNAGHHMFAFSNGGADAVEGLLVNADIREYFQGVVSVEDRETFKPNPVVYQHFLERSSAQAERAWLISSNPFDVIGAISVGMQAAWVQRSEKALFDPWGIEPSCIVSSLQDLPAALSQ